VHPLHDVIRRRRIDRIQADRLVATILQPHLCRIARQREGLQRIVKINGESQHAFIRANRRLAFLLPARRP
jgi:hypothetical protein